jgi:hypothetical protein
MIVAGSDLECLKHSSFFLGRTDGLSAAFLSGRSSAARQSARIRFGVPRAFANDLRQMAIQRVLRIRPIEPLITIAATENQIRAFEFAQFILHCSQRKEAQSCEFARIQLLSGIREEQSQHLGAHDREQCVEQRLFNGPGLS